LVLVERVVRVFPVAPQQMGIMVRMVGIQLSELRSPRLAVLVAFKENLMTPRRPLRDQREETRSLLDSVQPLKQSQQFVFSHRAALTSQPRQLTLAFLLLV
jgi:hypothetical protein